eukprot:Skav236280  [mRNA]  locus=scaffold4278:23881:24135:+ [translate_table: standard]
MQTLRVPSASGASESEASSEASGEGSKRRRLTVVRGGSREGRPGPGAARGHGAGGWKGRPGERWGGKDWGWDWTAVVAQSCARL